MKRKDILLLTTMFFLNAWLKAASDENGLSSAPTLVVERIKKDHDMTSVLVSKYQLICKESFDERHEIKATLDFSSHPLCGCLHWNIDKLELIGDYSKKEEETPSGQDREIIKVLIKNLEEKAQKERMTILTVPPGLNNTFEENLKEFFKHKFDLCGYSVLYSLYPEDDKKKTE